MSLFNTFGAEGGESGGKMTKNRIFFMLNIYKLPVSINKQFEMVR